MKRILLCLTLLSLGTVLVADEEFSEVVKSNSDTSPVDTELSPLSNPNDKEAERLAEGSETMKEALKAIQDKVAKRLAEEKKWHEETEAKIKALEEKGFSLYVFCKNNVAAILFGATGLAGAGIFYKYYWCQKEETPIVTMTIVEQKIIKEFVNAMAQDVKNAQLGKPKPSVVRNFDFSDIGLPLVKQCLVLQIEFMKRYNNCDAQGKHLEALKGFYYQVNDNFKKLFEVAVIA